MTKDLNKPNNTVPTTTDRNAFEAYAAAVDQQMIIGDLLKFTKGDYLVGRDGAECTETALAALMPGLVHGWIRWENHRPVEHVMGLLIEGFTPPSRDALGHLDKTTWELDDERNPRDPWRPGLYLPMITENCETVFTFTSTSEGARRNAIAPLCREYGHRIRQHSDEIPIVQLEQGSYQHPDRSRGRIKYPRFPVARWVKVDPYLAAVTAITGRSLDLLPGGTE
jgi:hypothetical protein